MQRLLSSFGLRKKSNRPICTFCRKVLNEVRTDFQTTFYARRSHMQIGQYESCIEACNECAVACNYCASSCLQEDNVKIMARCISLDLDCAAICRLAADAMARQSECASDICELCADICDACGEECEKHDMEHCVNCAAACRKCADECRNMAQMR